MHSADMEAVLFIGVQGAGKTTFYRQRLFDTHLRLSLDMLRTRRRQQLLMETCLATKQRFVVDNTNVRRSERAVYIAAAKLARFQVTGYYFRVGLGDALQRNGQRSGNQVVPVKGVIGTFHRIEPPVPEEGFDQLYIVELSASLEWRVQAWRTDL